MNRRQLLLGLGISSLVTPLLMRSARAAQTGAGKSQQSEEEVQLLFVQTAQGATLADGVLRLSGISPATIYFADRPERIAGHEPTEDFVAEWGAGENSFKADPPNATLSILTGPEPQEIVVVLKTPRLQKNDLVYDVDVLEGMKTAAGGASSLFIDTIGRPMSPGSIAGVHRRHRRRRRRAVGPGPR